MSLLFQYANKYFHFIQEAVCILHLLRSFIYEEACLDQILVAYTPVCERRKIQMAYLRIFAYFNLHSARC